MIENVTSADTYLYHYTTAEVATGYILPGRTVKLGRYQNTNDPKEARTWSFNLGNLRSAAAYLITRRRKMKLVCVPGVIAMFMLIAITSPSSIAASVQPWDTTTKVDQMDGSQTHFIHAKSRQTLTGSVDQGRALVGMNCAEKDIYLRVDGLGFETDRTDGSRPIQIVRTKVDDSEAYTMAFEIWSQNKDGMTYLKPRGTSKYGQDNLISDMKDGKELLVEVKLYNTKGREQIARFSLAGFNTAMNWCKTQDRSDKEKSVDHNEKNDRDSAVHEAMRKAQEQAGADEHVRVERLDGYKRAILRRMQSTWRQPEDFSTGDRAEVQVTQLRSGDVTDVAMLSCTGDAAFCDSVVSAVHEASPLPVAPDPEVFERVLQFHFRPGP